MASLPVQLERLFKDIVDTLFSPSNWTMNYCTGPRHDLSGSLDLIGFAAWPNWRSARDFCRKQTSARSPVEKILIVIFCLQFVHQILSRFPYSCLSDVEFGRRI